jgi:hypothetical protein
MKNESYGAQKSGSKGDFGDKSAVKTDGNVKAGGRGSGGAKCVGESQATPAAKGGVSAQKSGSKGG